jgi:hypothetical protein
MSIENKIQEILDESTGETVEEKVEVIEAPAEESKIDVSEDVNALLNGEELSEEFKIKATTIFEAAVVSRIKQESAKLQEAFDAKLAEEVEAIKEGLAEKVDGYLSYLAEKWIEDNEVALTNGVKVEVMEGFMEGLKKLFSENYIEVPEEKFDVLEDMQAKIEELEGKLSSSIDENVALSAKIKEADKKEIFASISEGLSDVQVDKFRSLAEEIVFEDKETYTAKLNTIRENYFTKNEVSEEVEKKAAIITEDTVMPNVVSTDSRMSAYINTLSR